MVRKKIGLSSHHCQDGYAYCRDLTETCITPTLSSSHNSLFLFPFPGDQIVFNSFWGIEKVLCRFVSCQKLLGRLRRSGVESRIPILGPPSIGSSHYGPVAVTIETRQCPETLPPAIRSASTSSLPFLEGPRLRKGLSLTGASASCFLS